MTTIRRIAFGIALASAAAAGFATTASAQSTPRIDQRQANQDRRIDQGVANGSLTKPEARRLDRGQAHVDRMEGRALADGTVTNRERAKIEHAQDVQSKRIYRQKHDAQVRR